MSKNKKDTLSWLPDSFEAIIDGKHHFVIDSYTVYEPVEQDGYIQGHRLIVHKRGRRANDDKK